MKNRIASFNRRDFLRGVSLSALGAASLPLAAREGLGPMVKEDAEPAKPGAPVKPGALLVEEHDVDLCVVGGGMGGL